MFETAELGRKLNKAEFDELEPMLRMELIGMQQELRKAAFPVIVLFSGVDGAGKSETVNLLSEWMDPRWLVTRAYEPPTQEESERPEFWRYWRDLPPKGRIGLFLSAWYSQPLLDKVYGAVDERGLDHRLDRIMAFESALAADGALILKFWMHLGKAAQKRRLKALEADRLQSWRVTEKDWRNWRKYDDFIETAERIIMRTSTGEAPWFIVEGADERYRSVAVTTLIRDHLRSHLATVATRRALRRPVVASGESATEAAAAPASSPRQPTVLDVLDMGQSLTKKAYATQLNRQQARLNLLQRRARAARLSTVLVFEGWDAAGKGGAVRRVTGALDARDYEVLPFAAPTDEERAQHYLWRFWRRLNRAGRVTIFDRSWYGRVLVERVEGFASEDEWRRAYAEIRDFEEQLVDHGMVVAKFWLHITNEEQLARFQAREATPWKSWKLTDEDWRNREKWGAYEQAVNEMVERTSTLVAPWTLVEGNDKRYARVKVVQTVCEALEARLGIDKPLLDDQRKR